MKPSDQEDSMTNRGFTQDEDPESLGNVQEENLRKESLPEDLSLPDGGRQAWIVVFATFIIVFLTKGLEFCFGLLLPSLQDHYKVSTAETTLTMSIMTSLTYILGPLSAVSVRMFGHRLTTIFGALLSTLGLLIGGLYTMYISSSTASILILYLTAGGLAGLGFSLMMLPSLDILTYYFSKHLGLATGLGTMGASVSQMVLGPLLNYIITTLGPGTSLCCLSGLVFLGVGSGLCFTIPGNVETQTQQGQDSSSNQTKDAIKTLLSSPKIYILCLHHFFFAFGLFTTYSYLSSRAIYFGINEDMNGVFLAIIGVTSCVSRVIFGMILDKYRHFSIQITVTALAINSIFVMTSSFFTSLTGQIVFCTVFGLTFGCYPTSTVILLRMTFQDVGLPYSLCFFSTGLSCIICPPIMGWLRDITGSFTGTFLTAGGLGLIGCLLPLLLLQLKRLEVPSSQD